MTLGNLKIESVSDGLFRLDGGAMFGIVPKPLWKKQLAPDDLNRITLGLNILLVDNGKERIIIDTGIGNKGDRKFNEIYGIEKRRNTIEDLKEKGYEPRDINKVILTHLHFDHAGGSTCKDGHGNLAPMYPRATYFIQKSEWEDAQKPNEMTRASYLMDNFAPLEETGQIELLDGDTKIADCVRVELTGGHTRGHQIALIESEGERVVHLGDLVPTSYHLPLPYIMGYDTFPLQTLEMRKRLYRKAVKGRWLLFFGHDFSPKVATLIEKHGKYMLDEKTVVRLRKG